MNELTRQISRKLYEEHVAVIGLLGRFEQALTRQRAGPPAPDDPLWSTLLAQRSRKAALEIGAPRAPGDRGVERNHRRQVAGREAPDFQLT